MNAMISILFLLNTFVYAVIAQEELPNLENLPIKVQYMALRPALWEEKTLIEEVNEKRNLGGLVFVYYTNVSDKPVGMREWYLNMRESGYYRLAGDVAWDRRYTDALQPGETNVLEICGTSAHFQIGKKADFGIEGDNWEIVCGQPGVFEAEKLRVTSIIMDKTLSNITIHIRSFIPEESIIKSVSFEGKKTKKLTLTSNKIEANGHAIARIELEQPFTPGALVLVKIETEINGNPQPIYSHRNAYADYFPNGTWGIEENQINDARSHHLNTLVKGANTSDRFFTDDYKILGVKAMTHSGIYPDVDQLRGLANHPANACWYLTDEPDWLIPPQYMMASNIITKIYASQKPTMITLCRNVKFFEYAFIPDIPCHDHYTVACGSTSKWPFTYGTYLEETGYYTADLKYASEPKPIWVWTQGLTHWDRRPKRPMITPDELGAQLYFNLSRGAKGNLWFTFDDAEGKKYPESKKAIQDYGRVIHLLENDILNSDPYHGKVAAPEKVDVASLITQDKLIVFVTNTNYQINDSAYVWTNAKNVKIHIQLPDWFNAHEGFEIVPDTGIKTAVWKLNNKSLELSLNELKMGRVFVFSFTKDARKKFENRYSEILVVEKKLNNFK